MNGNRWTLVLTWSLLVLALVLMGLMAGQSSHAQPVEVAAPRAELRVCSEGPPACDYATIQDAVDAAAEGDVVKVAGGVYSGVQAGSAVPIVAAPGSNVGGLLQYTADGHVLGFAPEAAYLATGSHALRVGFVGANAVQPMGEAGGGASPAGAPPLGRVTYVGLWEGITLTYEAVEEGVAKSTYHLAPGADVGQIQLAYNVPVQVQADGSLRLAFTTGEMSESAPLAWQEIEDRRVPVEVAFAVQGQTVGFRLGEHDSRYSLTIDPAYAWHTFYGSSGEDTGYGIALDSSGSVYVAGYSRATWLGDGGAEPLHAYSGDHDIAVLKLDSDGVYQWHTFYGSSDLDTSSAIAIDDSGGVYVAGQSWDSWQGDGGADPLHAHSGSGDIAVLKLDSAGTYQWHTFYGGTYAGGEAIAVDSGGNVHVTGWSHSTWQGDGGADPLHPYSGYEDISVLKLNSAGAYQWHTFYGASDLDRGYAIAVDGSGGVYVTGESSATWQGDGGADPLHPHSGDIDIAVLKLDSAGAYQWHTFYGSSDSDRGYAITVDSGGNVHVTGWSHSTWQGDGGADPLHPNSGGVDIAVLKLDSNGAYQWHTFYGASDSDRGYAITVDSNGGVYVTGRSDSTWQGDGGADPLHPHSGDWDITMLKLDSAGAYQWHTFYGSGEEDIGWAIAVDGSGSVYVAGYSEATWLGDNGANPLHAYSGYRDFAVLKLNKYAYGVMLMPPSDAASSDPGSDVVYTLTATNTGTTTDTFDVSLSGNDWPIVAPLAIGPLGSGVSATLGVTVSVPFTVGCGDVDTVIVTATSQHNAWASDSSTLTTTANTLYGLRVEPSTAALGGDPGSDLVYTLTVTNSGNCTDTFDVSLSGNDWPTVAPLTIGPLGSGVSATLGVTVSVPLGTRGGISDTVILTCTSQNDDTASDSSTLTTTANQVAPVLDPIGAQMVVMGHILTFTATAGDANADTLTFSLDAGAPEGAILDPVTGEFTWTPDTAGVYTATVRVTDDGVLPLDDFKAVIITVETEMLYVYLPLVVKNR